MPKDKTKPIDAGKDKDKKDKDKEKLKKAKKLEQVTVSANGSITAGGFVAEMDTGTLRKNTLRGS